jgi:GTPase SAR1 family protein
MYEIEIKKKCNSLKQQKLIFIGEGSAGKTSLLKALTKENFEVEHHSTVGVELKAIDNYWDIYEQINDLNFSERKKNIRIYFILSFDSF